MAVDFNLLRQLCEVQAPSGMEWPLKEFLLDYISKASSSWKHPFELLDGEEWGDGFALRFGTPRTAIFTHLDSIGFMTRYNRQVIRVGGPVCSNGMRLRAVQKQGNKHPEYTLQVNDSNDYTYVGEPELDRGVYLTFAPDFRESTEHVQCCYLDNRLGVWCALKVAEQLKDGLLVFTCWEEHGGGSAEHAARYMYESLGVRKALICDITWVTEGVHAGKGVAISIRDSGIPRRRFVDTILQHAGNSGIPYQVEVESSGGSDGQSIQRSPYPIDWCFIGAPEDFVHTPDELVHKEDIESMWKMFSMLMDKL